MDLLILATMNLTRNLRRSILNGAALAVGAAILILAFGWIRGYFTTLYGGIRSFDVGDAQVLDRRYLDDRLRLPLDELLPYQETRGRLDSLEELAAAAGRLEFAAQLSAGGKVGSVFCRGIDPGEEAKITVLAKHIQAGSYFGAEGGADQGGGLLLGSGFAEKLGVTVGDLVFVSARDAYGAANVMDLRVRGIFRYGYSAMDDGFAFMDLRTATELLGTGGKVSSIVLKSAPGVSPSALVAAVAKALGPGERVYPWNRFAQALVAAVHADSGSFTVLMAIVYLMIFLNVLNSLAVSVRERTREIGTLRAIGMKRGQTRLMIATEGMVLALIAGLIGSVIAIPGVYWLGHLGVDIGQYMPKDLPFPFGERFHADYRWWDFLVTVVGGMLMALLASVPAAGRASRILPAVAMRDSGEA